MSEGTRGSFGSKLGIVLATAGSAVGLGNVWRFPYTTGENGGAAFILIYIGCILLLGIPGMVSEFIVGRHAQANAAKAYDVLSNGRPWKFVGYLGILTSTIILGFYAVVAGWCLQYLFASIAGQINGDAEYVKNYFVAFSSDPLKPTLWGVAFILITHFVIVRGVRHGIEKASKLLMPILFILLLILVVASCMLPGALGGIRFLLHPDFSKLSSSVMLEALGQAFFSLSLGTACLCTYASYFTKDTNLLRSASQIAVIDTLIAVLSGLMIFPAAFSVGVNPDSGPSLIFITLPNVFQQAFAAIPALGYVVSIMFYALLVFAALTSTISMHEIGTAFFTEEFELPRKKSAWVQTIVAGIICVFCSLSVGAYSDLQLMGFSLMDFCDRLTANFLLPLGAMLACLFVGWYIPKQVVRDEFTNEGALKGRLFGVFLFAVRIVCPICITLIFLHQLGIV
ncbi:MAG: sodium-dependent transporter [Prevotella sp.]|nr:sodium-dependent transporter [Prevotella sp.]MBQ8714067.1 sodium-dependent transporter [Prevotella sp.]